MGWRRRKGWAFLTLGLVLAGVGAWRGELREVLLKAVSICFECIGLR